MAALTAMQSKAAREELGVSQAKVARATGINRSTLALFEVNKYILPDRTLHELRDFYESHGCALARKVKAVAAAPADPPLPAILPIAEPEDYEYEEEEEDERPVIDGFVVPSGLDHKVIEEILDELYANDEAIDDIHAQPVKRDLLDDIDPKPADRAMALMARSYLLVRQLRGHESLSAANANDSKPGKPETYGDVLRLRFQRSNKKNNG